MVQSCAAGKIEANLWLLWLPFTARHWRSSQRGRWLVSTPNFQSPRVICKQPWASC